jgi:hypothetical protein
VIEYFRHARRNCVRATFRRRDFLSERTQGVRCRVASRLSAEFGEERVLYDKYHEAEFARPNLDVYLPNLYRTQSELIVLFLCPEYAAKRWCNLEWRYNKGLLATADEHRIMLLRYGREGEFSELGILPGDGTIDFKGRAADEIANVIVERFKINGGRIRTNGRPPKETALLPPDISRIDRYAPVELIGREAETKLIDDAWAKAVAGDAPRPRVMAFVALGGEGKTALVAKWVVGMAEKGWPGAEAAFGWSFYSQGSSEQRQSSSDLFSPRPSNSSARQRSRASIQKTRAASSRLPSAQSAPRSSSTASSRCNIRRLRRSPGS